MGGSHQKDEDPASQDKRSEEITKGDLCRSIGMGLQKARYNAGYTQQEVADCLNFKNVKKVSRHESGENAPNIEDIILYFRLYNIRTISDIIPDYSIEVIKFMIIPNSHVYKAAFTPDDETNNDKRELWSISDATRNIPHLSAYMIRRMIKEGKIIPINYSFLGLVQRFVRT